MRTDNIDLVIGELCRYGALAVARYCEITGLPPDDMPEFFMPAFILDHFGHDSGLTMTLETRFRDLVRWNIGIKCGRRSEPTDQEVQAAVLAANYGRPKVDLVIFKDPICPRANKTFWRSLKLSAAGLTV